MEKRRPTRWRFAAALARLEGRRERENEPLASPQFVFSLPSTLLAAGLAGRGESAPARPPWLRASALKSCPVTSVASKTSVS